MELVEKSEKLFVGIMVFWSLGNYMEWLVKNIVVIIEVFKGESFREIF